MCGVVRRYGAAEPIVALALLRLLATCPAVAGGYPDRLAAIEEQAGIVVEDAERRIAQPLDVTAVRTEAQLVRAAVACRR
jgi:uncharacterized membrane protein